jgi:hypothetical protein
MSPLSKKCGNFDVSKPYESPRPVTGIALPFTLIALDAVHLQNELPITVTSPGRLLAPPNTVGKQQQQQKGSGGLFIAIIMGVLVDNTITKGNRHFGPYRDNEAESTHGLYEIFVQNNLPKTLAKFVGFTAEHPVYYRLTRKLLAVSQREELYWKIKITVLWDVTPCHLVDCCIVSEELAS